MCVAGNISSGLQLRVQGNKDLADQLLLHPRNKGYKGLADQALLQALFNQMLLRAHICVLQNTPGFQEFGRPTSTESMQVKNSRRISQHRVASKWPTKCGWEHAHTRTGLQNLLIQSCTSGPRATRVWQINCYCEHTHVHCVKGQLRVIPSIQGLRRFGRPSAAASIHMCIAQTIVCTQGPKLYQGFADQLMLRAYTCVLQSESVEGCNQGSSRVARVRPTN